MKSIYQTRFLPDRGNCLQAAIASLLELELDEVPDFLEEDVMWWAEMQRWLGERNLLMAELPPEINVPTISMLVGKSPRGEENHIVLADGDAILFDPHPDGTGIVTRSSRWFFVPIDPARVIGE